MAAADSPTAPPRSSQGAPHVAIIGAGVVGLVVAQALKKNGIAHTVYERDGSLHARGSGWGLTIHWALPALESLLPQHIIDRLPDVSVDQEVIFNGEGNFLFIELRSGRVMWKVPPNRRIRVKREWLRNLLAEDLNIQFGKRLQDVEEMDGSSQLRIRFDDSSIAEADVVLGCDGSRSVTRTIVCPGNHHNEPLPIRLFGASVVSPAKEAEKIRALDPLFLQGSDSVSDVFFFFSFLETPRNNPAKTDTYTCQVVVSWPYRPGFRGQAEPTDMPSSNAERLDLLKDFAKNWAEPFGSFIANISSDTEIKPIQLEDWPTDPRGWDNKGGRCTLLGDAAHTMTMYRGEGANHAIEDALVLLRNLIPALKEKSTEYMHDQLVQAVESPPAGLDDSSSSSPDPQSPTVSSVSAGTSTTTSTAPTSAPSPHQSPTQSKFPQSQRALSVGEAIRTYEADMFPRGKTAVLAARQACLDGHEYAKINDNSPLIAMRKKNTKVAS